MMQDLFTAVNSTAVTMEWALAELIKNPNILQKAAEEIKTTVGSSRVMDESDISNLPYLEAVVKETLRLHPPAPLIYRKSRKQCSIAGYPVPANTGLMVNVWAIGRDPRQWANALEFRPERFLREGGKGQVDVRGQHYQLLPFGSGRRACPGMSLALKMVQTTLGAMVQCFEWRVEGGVVDMEEGHGLILPRANPLICFPAPTLNPFPSASHNVAVNPTLHV